jgi:hypothetical protein
MSSIFTFISYKFHFFRKNSKIPLFLKMFLPEQDHAPVRGGQAGALHRIQPALTRGFYSFFDPHFLHILKTTHFLQVRELATKVRDLNDRNPNKVRLARRLIGKLYDVRTLL